MGTAHLIGLALAIFAQDSWEDRLKDIKVSITDAIDLALKEAGDGVAFHAELEGDAEPVYSIDISQGDESRNVHINAVDGKVVLNEVEDEDHSPEVKAAKIGLKDAIAAALKKGAGTVVEAELVLDGDRPVYGVKLFTGKSSSTVNVDGVTGAVVGEPAARKQDGFTETYIEDKADLGHTGKNPFFVLEPGYVLEYADKKDKLLITVLDETKKVDGVECRIVEEREWEGDELIEVSRNYFAISKRTNSVYYFGEDVDMYKDGKVVSHDGAWLSGEKDARWGLMMPGTPILGGKFYQEIAPGVAMDRAEILSLTETVETKAGKFEKVLKTLEDTPLEKGKEHKFYAPGVGLIQDADMKLVKYGKK